jgi:hypothetical protein
LPGQLRHGETGEGQGTDGSGGTWSPGVRGLSAVAPVAGGVPETAGPGAVTELATLVAALPSTRLRETLYAACAIADAASATAGTAACTPSGDNLAFARVTMAITPAMTWTNTVWQNCVVVHPGSTVPGW